MTNVVDSKGYFSGHPTAQSPRGEGPGAAVALGAPAAPAGERRVTAWIGKAVRVEGKVISHEDLTIDGDVEGSIELGGHSLVIGSGASIKADLLARTVTISGVVKGNVKAVEKVDLRSSASVEGDISAPRLVMADGANVIGKVEAG